MSRTLLTALGLMVTLGLPACKIIKSVPVADGTAADSDEARIAALVDQSWHAQMLPLLTDQAQDLAVLRPAVMTSLDDAGLAMGNRGAGEGAAWAFAVKGQGIVVAANLESRARKAELDTDGDGMADMTLQLGPVIKGTALRDAAPFFQFTDFRDQIEFALLARHLNDRATADLTLPEGELLGAKVQFSGAFVLKAASDPWVVTAVTLQVLP